MHCRGFPEPVGLIVTKYSAKPSHLDLFHAIFNAFAVYLILLRVFCIFLKFIAISQNSALFQRGFRILCRRINLPWDDWLPRSSSYKTPGTGLQSSNPEAPAGSSDKVT